MESAIAQAIRAQVPPVAIRFSDQRPARAMQFTEGRWGCVMWLLANYDRRDGNGVIIPFVAGCQAVGILPYREARSEDPRAVVGLVDISARAYIAPQLGRGLMSFAMPFALYQRMEANVPGSFLERSTWRQLIER